MGLGPDVDAMARKVATELQNPKRDLTITFQRRIRNAVNAASRDTSMHQYYFEQVQRRLAQWSGTARSARAAQKDADRKVSR